jgi:hypothetical protein
MKDSIGENNLGEDPSRLTTIHWGRRVPRAKPRKQHRDAESHALWVSTQPEGGIMPSAEKSTTPIAMDLDVMEGRYAELGDYTVGFETYKQTLDAEPYFRGLPDDRCSCIHLGFVTSGQITFRYQDHEETYVEGDAYVAPPGHLPVITAGTSVVEFTRTADLGQVMEVIGRNLDLIGVPVQS